MSWRKKHLPPTNTIQVCFGLVDISQANLPLTVTAILVMDITKWRLLATSLQWPQKQPLEPVPTAKITSPQGKVK